jgi:2-iminobutanoate/2-iminopropanoate deaminase
LKSARTIIQVSELPAVNPTYSQAIQARGFVFVSGQIGIGPGTGRLVSDDIAEQARQAIENTASILRSVGSSLDKVVSANIYLTDYGALSQVNQVYGEYFTGGGPGRLPPAKMSCGVTKLYGGAKFEIQVIALA